MKLNIQLFGNIEVNSGSRNTAPKKATFLTAIYNTEKGIRENVNVSGIIYKYNEIEIGIYGKKQNAKENITTSDGNNYVAVVLTNNEASGTMIETGKTRKEAIEKTNNLIDKRKKDILRAIESKGDE